MYNKFKSFLIENKLIILATLIIGGIVHFNLYTNELILSDCLQYNELYNSFYWEYSLGRWFIPVLQKFTGNLVVTSLKISFSFIYISLTNVIICKIFNIKNEIIKIIICGITITIPAVSDTLFFIFTADLYFFSLLLSVIASYLLIQKNKLRYHILAASLIVLSLAVYQSYILVTITICLMDALIKLLNNEKLKSVLVKLGKYIIFGIISVITYTILFIFFTKLNHVNISSYKGFDKVSVSFLINNFLNFTRLYDLFFKYMFTDEIIFNFYWHRNNMNNLIIIVLIFEFIYLIFKNKLYKSKNLIFIILFIALIPISLNAIELILPNLIYSVMSFQYSLVYILSLALISYFDKDKIYRYLSIFIISLNACVSFTFILSDNASYICRKEIHNNYYYTCSQIINKIQNIDGYNTDMQIAILGYIKHTPKISMAANSLISTSPETWTNYNHVVLFKNYIIRYFGYEINLCDVDTYTKIAKTKEYADMPIFPNDGSVKVINDVIVVKIAEEYLSPEDLK